jgi:pimeloyl-ACP methyl ester carboxylesterase
MRQGAAGCYERPMATWRELTRGGARLACRDFGGHGPSVLLLHGLAGHAEEWAQTASWLTARCRVVAPDARGHGRSERYPADVSRAAVVADAAFVLEQLGLRPAVVVGQSLGGLTALSLAARRPDLVRGLVLVDASPSGGEGVEEAVGAIACALREWPASFESRSDAHAFFVERFGAGLAAQAWTSGLERAQNRWQPRFDADVMAQTLRAAICAPSWDEWESIECPALVVRAGDGIVAHETVGEMTERLPGAQLVEITGAAHDLHLDRPDEWRRALTAFLDGLPAPTRRC